MTAKKLYVLTPLADQDLDGIWGYTEETWGHDQATTYLLKLDTAFEKLAKGQLPSRSSPVGSDDLKFARCEHHFIFFLPESPLQIIRVLHERMDFARHIVADKK